MWGQVAKDNVKACVPFKATLRRWLRKVRPYQSLPDNDAYAVEQGLQLIGFLREHELAARDVLEVGTGWIPTIPHLLKAWGAERLVLTDIERLCDAQTMALADGLARRTLPRISEISGIDEATLEANLARDGIEDYRCPPALDELPDRSLDLVYSRTVLEHIPKPVLTQLLQEWKRLLRPGGCCIHFIDNSDHFEHRDDRLSRLNFLTLSSFAWRVASFNGQNYQNRLRHSDYVTLFDDAGFELLHIEGVPDPKALEDLRTLPIDAAFRHYEPGDLATLTSIIIARNADAPANQR
ncbi:MAG: class I SAM-dependent methyltransferase [Pseudomonadota bacterium]